MVGSVTDLERRAVLAAVDFVRDAAGGYGHRVDGMESLILDSFDWLARRALGEREAERPGPGEWDPEDVGGEGRASSYSGVNPDPALDLKEQVGALSYGLRLLGSEYSIGGEGVDAGWLRRAGLTSHAQADELARAWEAKYKGMPGGDTRWDHTWC